MSFLSATLGRLSPRYRTLAQWEVIYSKIMASRGVTAKTACNRNACVRRLLDAFGTRTISSIRPHEIAGLIVDLSVQYPHAAARTLIEAQCMFNEALQNGWVDTNPAVPVRRPVAKVVRDRLSLDQWQRIHDWSDCCSPPWVARMMVLALVTGQRRGDLRKMRFSDVWDGHLHIEQEKTGAKVALPLTLRMDAIGVSIGEAIEACRGYAPLDANGDGLLLRKTTTGMLAATSMSWRFEQAREGALPPHAGKGTPASFHECRSLSERLYREQGVNTRTLLGHSKQAMTDLYNRDRKQGPHGKDWKILEI